MQNTPITVSGIGTAPLLIEMFRYNDAQYCFNSFDQKVFISRNIGDPNTLTYEQLEKITKTKVRGEENTEHQAVYLDNITYLQITPAQNLIPTTTVFDGTHVQYLLTTRAIEGKIGFNATPINFFEALVNLDYGTRYKQNAVKVDNILVILSNPSMTLRVSAIILCDVVIHGFESELRQEALPQQYIHNFYAKDMYLKDFKVNETRKFHPLFQNLI